MSEGVNVAKLQPLVVTTAHKGVFFGYGIPSDAPTIRLEQARMCVYWSRGVQSVLGLAEKGPQKDCRIGPSVPAITLRDVTSIIEVSVQAVKQWEKGFWSP